MKGCSVCKNINNTNQLSLAILTDYVPDKNHQLIAAALTLKKYVRKIMVNESLEYYKAQQHTRFSAPETEFIHAQRKIDVEPVFGRMKACLHFNRFSVRDLAKVKRELGIVIITH